MLRILGRAISGLHLGNWEQQPKVQGVMPQQQSFTIKEIHQLYGWDWLKLLVRVPCLGFRIYSLKRRLCENCPVLAWSRKFFCLGRSPKPLSKVNNKQIFRQVCYKWKNAHFICTTFVGPLLNEGIWGQILLLFRHLRLQNLAFWEEVPSLRDIWVFGGKNWTSDCNRISTTTTTLPQKSLLLHRGWCHGRLTY
jgi:hypothetical protein